MFDKHLNKVIYYTTSCCWIRCRCCIIIQNWFCGRICRTHNEKHQMLWSIINLKLKYCSFLMSESSDVLQMCIWKQKSSVTQACLKSHTYRLWILLLVNSAFTLTSIVKLSAPKLPRWHTQMAKILSVWNNGHFTRQMDAFVHYIFDYSHKCVI